jgi:hypothetical protein
MLGDLDGAVRDDDLGHSASPPSTGTSATVSGGLRAAHYGAGNVDQNDARMDVKGRVWGSERVGSDKTEMSHSCEEGTRVFGHAVALVAGV